MRPPIIPNGTAKIATSLTWPNFPPRSIHLLLPSQIARNIPIIIKREYARKGNGPMFRTPVLGLGIVIGIKSNYFLASATTPAKPAGSATIAVSISLSFKNIDGVPCTPRS